MTVVFSGNLFSYLARYLFLGFLVVSVIYSTLVLFGSENLQKNAAGLIQKGANSLNTVRTGGYGRVAYSVFDVENFNYSAQQMVIQSPHRAPLTEPNRHEVPEDYFLSKAFGNAMQPSRVIPYYFKAEGKFDKEDITITTLITEN
ncbi:hypothetical protein BGZ94_009781, partial [Podila epigama]